ncbi:MAG: hypothetical protein A3K67_05315 [Euryarchaeota archaeon RBG_16_62_10]|nr:MAG: hypothetical protein A3K67_05315 [Euryarchaeota archaeon RBG_16_62_10]
MNRKLAVPLAFGECVPAGANVLKRLRILRDASEDAEEIDIMRKLAENHTRLELLREEIESDCEFNCDDEDEIELDYLKASIQLGLLEITGELEEIPCSEEIFEGILAE